MGFTSSSEPNSNSRPSGIQASIAGSRAQRSLPGERFDYEEEGMYRDSLHTVNDGSASLISIWKRVWDKKSCEAMQDVFRNVRKPPNLLFASVMVWSELSGHQVSQHVEINDAH